MVSVAPPRSVELKVYVPLSCGSRTSVIKCPELVSLIPGLFGEIVYPLGMAGAKLETIFALPPIVNEAKKIGKNTHYY